MIMMYLRVRRRDLRHVLLGVSAVACIVVGPVSAECSLAGARGRGLMRAIA